MTDKERILAEIERLQVIYSDEENIHDVAKYNALQDIKSFINSLPEENTNSIPKDELQTWLKKQFKVSEKVMVRAERDWDRAYNNGEMTAYNNVINKVDSYDRRNI